MLAAAIAHQVHAMLEESGLAANVDLARAAGAALAGRPRPVTDEVPVGLAVRQILREDYEAQQDRLHPRPRLSAGERHRRAARQQGAQVIRGLVAWGPGPALAGIIQYRRRYGRPGWRDQFLQDLAGAQVPAADRRQAEQLYQQQLAGIPRPGHQPRP